MKDPGLGLDKKVLVLKN